jgi:hypothetical protein
MKLLIRDTQLIGTATDDYAGPETFIAAPDDFDPLADLGRYEYRDGALSSIIPQTVSRFQARAALHLSGLLESVETLMQSPETDMLARLAWQDAQEFKRQSPTVLAMASALSLDDEALDALFTTASGIEA